MTTLSAHAHSAPAGAGFAQQPACMSAVTLRHLRGASEISSVLALRNGIDLSAHAGSPQFLALEKKETR